MERMNHLDEQYRTPGQLIAALLQEKGWSQRVLSLILGIDERTISNIVSDKRPMNAKLAVTLESVFDVPAERFMELQKTYDLAVARIEDRPDPERATRAHLFGDLPIAAMIQRGWIEAKDVRDAENVQASLQRFFGVNRLEDVEFLPHAAKRTDVSINATPVQLAWLYRVRAIASEMMVARYSQEAVEGAIRKIAELRQHPEELRKVPRILAEAGIRFVIVETLPSAKIDGVCFWLNDASPVIGMTMRFDRIDNFLFVLRHELEHVRRRDGLHQAMLDVDLDGAPPSTTAEVEAQEKLANDAAADFCVPKKMMDAFVARKAPFFSERDLIGFARTLKVHPGVVAGQLQRRLEQYNRFRGHLVKIREIVQPNAVVDGWGDIYPLGE